jgi:hypothetical protein
MTMMDMTNIKLARITNHAVTDIPEIFVHIAKYEILTRSGPETIADILGVSVENVTEVQTSPVYRDIRLVLATENARSEIDRDISYDSLEELALGKLVKVAQFESDVDTLIRIATMANRAERRAKPKTEQVLDARSATTRVPLKLSERIVRRINADGGAVEERTRVMITNGSAANPTFEDVEKMLIPQAPAGMDGVSLGDAANHTTFDNPESRFANPLVRDPDSKIPTFAEGVVAKATNQLTPGAKDKLRELAARAAARIMQDPAKDSTDD